MVWALVVEALDVYGSKGRFYNLDILSGRTQRRGDPLDLWAAAESAAVDESAALYGLLGQEEFTTALSTSVAVSIHRWWTLITLSACMEYSGATGVKPSAPTYFPLEH